MENQVDANTPVSTFLGIGLLHRKNSTAVFIAKYSYI